MKKIPPELRHHLLEMLEARPNSMAEVDELFNILLQLTLAIMLVFMLAFYLYKIDSGSDLAQVDQMRQELLDAQANRITAALESVREEYRERYGLTKFQIPAADGTWLYAADTLIENGRLSEQPLLRNAFITGGKAAFSDYADLPTLAAAWTEQSLKHANLRSEELSLATATLLQEEIQRRIVELRQAVNDMQFQAAAAVQKDLARHPERVQNERIQALLARITATGDPELRRPLVTELAMALKQYAFDQLRIQTQMPLLEELK